MLSEKFPSVLHALGPTDLEWFTQYRKITLAACLVRKEEVPRTLQEARGQRPNKDCAETSIEIEQIEGARSLLT